jgi:hypothetical protein
MGALIAEEDDPCARCEGCGTRFLLTVDGYHSHLLDEDGCFLFANRERYEHLGAAILYSWEPISHCPHCRTPIKESAGPTMCWGGYGGE